jgi:hypothetical protein
VPFAQTGERAVEMLLSSIAGQDPPAEPVLLPVELIIRDSSGSPPVTAPDSAPSAGAAVPQSIAPTGTEDS